MAQHDIEIVRAWLSADDNTYIYVSCEKEHMLVFDDVIKHTLDNCRLRNLKGWVTKLEAATTCLKTEIENRERESGKQCLNKE